MNSVLLSCVLSVNSVLLNCVLSVNSVLLSCVLSVNSVLLSSDLSVNSVIVDCQCVDILFILSFLWVYKLIRCGCFFLFFFPDSVFAIFIK